MIDYLALAIGHGLLAIALLRLALNKGLDEDQLVGAIRKEAKGKRKAQGTAARNAARRAQDSERAA